MKTYVYCKVPSGFIETEETFEELGSNYDDFLKGLPVELTEDQALFHKDNPGMYVIEVLNVKFYDGDNIQFYDINLAPTVESEKKKKLDNLWIYDSSDEVNDFTINNTIHAWINPTQRAQYKNSIESAKLLGVETLTVMISDINLTIPTQQAEIALAKLQLYADTCYNVTENHKLNISKLTTMQEIWDYDYTVGYPEKLNFNIEQ